MAKTPSDSSSPSPHPMTRMIQIPPLLNHLRPHPNALDLDIVPSTVRSASRLIPTMMKTMNHPVKSVFGSSPSNPAD